MLGTLATRDANWPSSHCTKHRKIEILASEKGYDDQSLRDGLSSAGVRPLLRLRLFAAYDHAHNYGWIASHTVSAG
jgi:IS5 family transposase